METLKTVISASISFFEEIQLSKDLSQLRSSLPIAHIVINRAEWGRFKDKNLALLLSQLKDTTCDAEDLLREFNDQELGQKMEDNHRNRAGQIISSSYNLAKSFLIGSKTRLKEVQSKLDKVVGDTEAALNLMGLNVEPAQLGKQLMPETSSVVGVSQVFGRDEERDLVIEKLGVIIGRDNERDHAIERLGVPLTRSSKATRNEAATIVMDEVASTSRTAKRLKREGGRVVSTKTNCSTVHVSVLPIVGIGGVGKTTLAQFIYNDTRVKKHFDVRLWVCVSDIFDKRRIMREIITSISGGKVDSSDSLDALQVKMNEQLAGQKFIMVLDDVWLISQSEWEAFFAPFRFELNGSMILLTTRFPKVAKIVSTLDPIELEGLPTDIFWEFFKKCAFSGQNPELYPQLQDIGRSIADRLRGSPLAAKTLGRLLSMELTQQNWRNIQSSELWQLAHEENEILPALQLSYLYLPLELKRCFAVCSMFPNDYSFGRDEIVRFWVALCFVQSDGSMRLEDMGGRYLDDLRSRFLFQTDPKYPKQNRYVMHDLIHDMAQSVSVGECFLMQDMRYNNLHRPQHTVRHMSIVVDNEALSRMGGIKHLKKLHSLRLGAIFEVEVSWFKHLSNILYLSLKGCKLVKLPESICELKSLRCLDISDSTIQELPGRFWRLHSLQYLYANCLKEIHKDVTKLVNLRHFGLPAETTWKLSIISGLGNMSCLQNLKKFTVEKGNGHRIGELKGMNQLSGKLRIYSLPNVDNTVEAAGARLVDKQYLKALYLDWGQGTFFHYGGQGTCMRSRQTGVLEGLCPPSSIECLEITKFGGDSFPPSWLRHENLPALTTLCISFSDGVETFDLQRRTSNIEALRISADGPPDGSACTDSAQEASIISNSYNASRPFTSLKSIYLYECKELRSLDQCLSPQCLPSIQSIQLARCDKLESLPVHKFGGFVCLQDLKITNCWGLVCPTEMIFPPSLQRLKVYRSGELDKALKPGCLEGLASLTLLHLEHCPSVESILLNSINTNNLKCLVLKDCPELSSIGGSHALSLIQHVDISGCPKLTEVQGQALLKKGLGLSELSGLQSFNDHRILD